MISFHAVLHGANPIPTSYTIDCGIACVEYSLLFGYSTWHHTLQEPHFVVAHGGT